MDKTSEKLSVIVVLLGIMTACYLVCLFVSFQKDMERFEKKLFLNNIKLVDGIVESPPLILKIEDESAFFEKIKELNITIVYRHRNPLLTNYYIFNPDMTIAYKYTIA